jgi:hypothetical protein
MMGGLQRDSNNAESSYVFPSLRAAHGGRCALLETNAIRACINDKIEKKQNSSKGIRVGSTSQLQADSHVTDTETNAAGGWAEYTNMRFYTRQSLALLLAPARSLAHWYHPREKHFVPSFDSLNVDEHLQLEALLALLYLPNEVPELQWKDGKEPKHHNFMVTVSASLIMRYPEIRDNGKYRSGGGSPIVHRIIKVAMEAWNFQTAQSADDRLQLLSNKIRASFMQKIDGRQREHPDAVERNESLLTRLGDIATATQSTTLRNTDDIARLQHQVMGLRADVVQNTQSMETMTGMLQSVMDLLRNQQRQQDHHAFSSARLPMETPQQQIERASLKIGDDDNDEILVPLGDETEDGANLPLPTNHESPQRDAFQFMMRTNAAKLQGLLPSDGAVQSDDIVSDFLFKLYQDKKLLAVHDGGAMDGLSMYFSNRQTQHKAKHALLLVDCLFLSKEERMRYTLCNVLDKAETKGAEKFFREMNERCTKATAYLEEQKVVSNKRKPNVVGIGNIVNKKKDQLERWKPSWVATDPSAKPVEKLVYQDLPPSEGETFAAFLERFFNNKKRKMFKR